MKPLPIKIVPPGQGQAYWAMTEKLTQKLGPDDTANTFSFAETLAHPNGGPPPHLHQREDEMFIVLEGEFAFVLGNKTFQRREGFAAYLPKNVVHAYNNIGQKSSRLLVLTTPCGFEQFISQWGKPAALDATTPPVPTPADIEKLMGLAPKFGIVIHPEVHPTPDTTIPRTDPAYWVLGHLITFKLTGTGTAGNYSVVEVASPPDAFVPPHIHVAMDELFYVVEGTFEFTFADRTERLGPGGLAYVPRGNLHGFRNAGSAVARLIDLHTPASFENFFIEAGIPATDPKTPPTATQPDMDRLRTLFRKHGMELPS